MKGYSIRATINFEIERFRDKDSGEYIHIYDPKIPKDDNGFEYEYRTILLTIVGTITYEPAIRYGKPEDCCEEYYFHEIESMLDALGNDWHNKVSDYEYSSILELLEEDSSGFDESKYDRD